MEWESVALLAFVLTAEGVTRTGADKPVLRLGITGRWRLTSGIPVWRDWRLTSWLPSLVVSLPLSPRQAAAEPKLGGASSAIETLGSIRGALTLVRVLGSFECVILVIGVPWATGRFAVAGLVSSVIFAALLSTEIAVVTALALRDAGIPFRDAVRASARLLSPFSAPRAGEVLVGLILATESHASLILGLADRVEVAAALRHVIHDLQKSGSAAQVMPWQAEVAFSLSEKEKQHALQAPQYAIAGKLAYCPRCGTVYQRASKVCSDCSVTLMHVER